MIKNIKLDKAREKDGIAQEMIKFLGDVGVIWFLKYV